jgi:hypothetical protein
MYLPNGGRIDKVGVTCHQRFEGLFGLAVGVFAHQAHVIGCHFLIHAHRRVKGDNYFSSKNRHFVKAKSFETYVLNTSVAFSGRIQFNRQMIKILRMILLVLVILAVALFIAERFGVKLPFISK